MSDGEPAFPIDSVVLEPQPTAVVRGHVEQRDLPAFLGGAFGETVQAITVQQHAPAGPPFARFRMNGTGFDVEAGFPSTGPVTAVGRVEPGELPGGTAVEILYRGDYGGVGAAYEAARKWLAEQGFTPNGDPWEAYLDEPGVAEPRTRVRLPYRAG
jgi:effector-binding domain-containing protein